MMRDVKEAAFWARRLSPKTLMGRLGEFVDLYRWIRMKYLEERYRKNRQSYWEAMHAGCQGLAAVGPSLYDNDQNERVYAESRLVFLDFMAAFSVYFRNRAVLEVGAGTGYFTRLIAEEEPWILHAVDISEKSVSKIRSELGPGPGFHFWRSSMEEFSSDMLYDWIVCLDVTQHITDGAVLAAGLKNLKSHLSRNAGGGIILTSYLRQPEETGHSNFHVRYWNREVYEEIFPQPSYELAVFERPFNSKQLFLIRPRQVRLPVLEKESILTQAA